MIDFIPLIAPKPFADFTPAEFHAYVRSLYREPEKAAPPAEFSARLNAKGNPVITVRRKPKWLSAQEVSTIATDLGLPLQACWLMIVKRKIEIRVPKRERGKR